MLLVRSSFIAFTLLLACSPSLQAEHTVSQIQQAVDLLSEGKEQKAILAFLDAIKTLPPPSHPYVPSPQEHLLYEEALNLYLATLDQKPHTIAEQLEKRYLGVLKSNPHYLRLNYFLGIASANLGDMADLFQRFYQSYQKDPDTFLAYRTLAILHLKLWEHAKSSQEKNLYRQKVLAYFAKALDKNSRDSTVYKFLIAFSTDEERPEALKKYGQMLLDMEVQIPRKDMQYFLAEAFRSGELEFAEKLIERGKAWYHYSRLLTEAQNELRMHKHSRKTERGEG